MPRARPTRRTRPRSGSRARAPPPSGSCPRGGPSSRSRPPCRSRSWGASAVTSISERWTRSSIRCAVGAPAPRRRTPRNVPHASASRPCECRRFRIITGLKTLSSKLPWLTGDLDGRVVAEHLHATIVIASDWVGFTLPGMIERAGLVLGQHELADPGARSRPEPADVVRDLHQRSRRASRAPRS